MSWQASNTQHEAEEFLEDLKQRFSKFALQLHPEKTRLIEFGRFAAENRRNRGEGKPETFNFLGFTHICGKTRSGKFTVLRKTIRKHNLKWERMKRLIAKWLPPARVCHSYPVVRFGVIT
jgi:hypothetical protein